MTSQEKILVDQENSVPGPARAPEAEKILQDVHHPITIGDDASLGTLKNSVGKDLIIDPLMTKLSLPYRQYPQFHL